MAEKDLLEIYKERIKNEAKHGDKADACRYAKYSARTYLNAMAKNKIHELTDGEFCVIEALIKILDQRKSERQKVKSNGT